MEFILIFALEVYNSGKYFKCAQADKTAKTKQFIYQLDKPKGCF